MAPTAERESTSEKPSTRRERGVLAQRAYRRRHASKFQSLKEENERLRNAINHIGLVAAGQGRFNRDLDTAIQTAKSISISEDGDDSGQQNEKAARASPSGQRAGSAEKEGGSPSLQAASAKQGAPPGFRSIPTGHGIFIDADMKMRTFAMPANCVTYFGDGDDAKSWSLAGAMYKAVLSIAIRRWHDHFERERFPHAPDFQPPPINYAAPAFQIALNPLSPTPLKSAFPLLPPVDQGDLIPPCIFSRPPSEPVHETSPTCAHDLSMRCRINESEGWWRAADGVEAFLRQHVLPPEGIAIFEEVMRGGGTAKQIEDVRDMLEGLARNYKCFGDGPRWNAVYVTVGMNMFRKDIMNEPCSSDGEGEDKNWNA